MFIFHINMVHFRWITFENALIASENLDLVLKKIYSLFLQNASSYIHNTGKLIPLVFVQASLTSCGMWSKI